MSLPDSGGNDFLEQMLSNLIGLMGGSAGATQPGRAGQDLRGLDRYVGEPEPNVEPVVRMHLEELARVWAELHVSELTGSSVTPSGAPVEVVAVGPGLWAWHTLEDWRFVLEARLAPRAPRKRHASRGTERRVRTRTKQASRGASAW